MPQQKERKSPFSCMFLPLLLLFIYKCDRGREEGEALHDVNACPTVHLSLQQNMVHNNKKGLTNGFPCFLCIIY